MRKMITNIAIRLLNKQFVTMHREYRAGRRILKELITVHVCKTNHDFVAHNQVGTKSPRFKGVKVCSSKSFTVSNLFRTGSTTSQ